MGEPVRVELSREECAYLLRLIDRRTLLAEDRGTRHDPATRIRRAIIVAMQQKHAVKE